MDHMPVLNAFDLIQASTPSCQSGAYLFTSKSGGCKALGKTLCPILLFSGHAAESASAKNHARVVWPCGRPPPLSLFYSQGTLHLLTPSAAALLVPWGDDGSGLCRTDHVAFTLFSALVLSTHDVHLVCRRHVKMSFSHATSSFVTQVII